RRLRAQFKLPADIMFNQRIGDLPGQLCVTRVKGDVDHPRVVPDADAQMSAKAADGSRKCGSCIVVGVGGGLRSKVGPDARDKAAYAAQRARFLKFGQG